jgi:peroxiredoxin
MQRNSKRKRAGDQLAARALSGLNGETIAVPDPARLVHLQFRRFAGCPVCDLHLRSFVRRGAELTAHGVREVVLFHSSAPELRAYAAHTLPFSVVADPSKRLYAEFGVESAVRSLASPRAWWPIVRAVAHTLWRVLRGEAPLRAPKAEHGRLGLPADVLIDQAGRVIACKYGEHANDQWSVDDLLAIVGNRSESAPEHDKHGTSARARAQ